jgi:hypothetical protein
MIDVILLYISAAADLEVERESLSRVVVEIPTTLGWRIIQSPIRGEVVDREAVTKANIHLLLLGSDIRAPIGLEWLLRRRAGRIPALFLKQTPLRTPAAQEFIRHIEEQASWRLFKDTSDLSQQALQLFTDHILQHAQTYALTLKEMERLSTWRKELDVSSLKKTEETRGGIGESSVILSPERYVPKEGVLIKGRKSEE